jgi:MoaA/NifB/PqqE/SkfB family radical SAM enzyme
MNDKLLLQMRRTSEIKPRTLVLDASTVCQLRCHTCPNAEGKIARYLGSGFLRFTDFREALDKNTYVNDVFLSEWGEPLLNPELIEMVKYAYEHGVRLYASSNLNTLTRPLAQALVKYQFHYLMCSIDGADNDSYRAYRRGGNFERVIENIKLINEFKREYDSRYPQLMWQYVPFGHNEELISVARKMAQDLHMRFQVKLAWGNTYGSEAFSPVKNKELVRAESGLGTADKEEYYQKYGVAYKRDICTQLWVSPYVTYDGRVLGCCMNFWGDYGNAFQGGLLKALNNEKMSYARAMLIGEKPQRDDIPCTTCMLYDIMKTDHNWLSKEEILAKSPTFVNRLTGGLLKIQRKYFAAHR